VAAAQGHQAIERGAIGNAAGGVVREIDRDQPRFGRIAAATRSRSSRQLSSGSSGTPVTAQSESGTVSAAW
jgi:hypothetical protein